MLNFWNTQYPFNDFILVAVKDSQLIDVNLISDCQSLGLEFSEKINIGQYNVLIAASQLVVSYQNIVLSGIAQIDGNFYYGQGDTPHQVSDDFGDNVGIFTAILKSKNTIKVTQDIIGCGVNFYAEHAGNVYVSNRYHLLLKILSSAGFKGEIDKAKLATTLYNSKSVFLEANFSSKMDIKGVNQLPLHKEIIFDSQGFKVIDKKSTLDAFKDHNIDRDELLENAKNEIIENISSVFKSNRFSKIVTDLSGGYDSRVVFAGILNVDGAISKTEINTRDVPNSRDLEIAAGLKNLFGAKFYREEGRAQKPQTVSESLDIWRSYFMGTYYRLGNQAWSPKGDTSKSLRLSGGVGEIYRTLWSNTYGKLIVAPLDAKELAEGLVENLPFTVKSEFQKDIIDLIENELELIPGKTPIEKLENYYLYFRNRYHYGMRAYEFYHDCPMWFPLLSKSMFNMSMSNFEERNNSKLELELTEKLHPLLIWIDYDKKSAADNPELSKMGDTRFKSIQINSKDSCEEWAVLNSENKSTILASRERMSHEFNMEWRDVNNYIKESILLVFRELKESNVDFNEMYDSTFESHIIEQTNTRYLNEMYARLFSIKDQLDIFN